MSWLQAMKQKQRAYGNAKFRSVAQVDGVDEDFYSDIYESGPLPGKGKLWEGESYRLSNSELRAFSFHN